MSRFITVIQGLDWSPLGITLSTGLCAAAISFFLALWLARASMRLSSSMRAILDSILMLPMVLPPTAAGFLLLLLFSLRRPFGSFLYHQMGIRVVQTFAGCVIAAVVIAFPLMYRSVRAAFEQVEPQLIYAARTLGMRESVIFWRVVVPTAGPGVVSGLVMTFARAMGEYGATSMLAGNIAGKTGTISQRIAMVIQNGDYLTAGIWVVLVLVIALVLLAVIQLTGSGSHVRKERW